MNQELMLGRIAMLLSRFTESVKIMNANGEFNINVHAENALIKLLNVLFNCQLENVNYIEGKQYPSIDLRDKNKRIAVQVTADESLAKVTDCLKKFIDYGLDKEYDVLYIVMLVRKQKSYSKASIDRARKDFPFTCDNILAITDLYTLLNEKNDLEAIETILAYLEAQFSDKVDYDVHQQYYSDLKDYDDSVVRQYEYVDVTGYSPKINALQVKVSLNDLYVSQILKLHGNKEQISLPISRLLLKENKSVILGDPGSGKSTLLKWLMFDICAHRGQYSLDMPVYIKCAAYAQKLMHDQLDLGAYILTVLNLKNERLYLDGLANGNMILLLDGLDEIGDVCLRHDVVDNINLFAAQNPTCRVVVTSRRIGYNETRLDAHFTHYELLPFNNEQIYEFIKNWYMAVDTNQYDEQSVKFFIRSLRKNTSVYQLAGTPLLLMIICLIQYQGVSLPENRIELYEIATATLLENWVKKRNRHGKGNFARRVLIGLLSPVAFDMQENGDDGIISEVAFRNKILDVYRKQTINKGDIEIEQEIDSLITYIKEEAGFLREIGIDERGVGQFSFIHLTFQEYFAAIRMASKWQMGMKAEEFNAYILAPHWSEVIVLTAEYLYMMGADPELGCELASRFIGQILETKDSIEERDRPIQLILRMLKSGIVVNGDLLQKIIDTALDSETNLPYHIDIPNNGDVHDVFVNTLVRRFYGSPEDDRISDIMMNMSGDLKIQEALCSCLVGDDFKTQKKLFYYRTVYPVAPITKTEIFRDSITKYVNSNEMKVTDYIPPQYTLSYVNDEEHRANAQQIMQAIRAIKSTELRQKYAEEVFREVLWGGVTELREFATLVKNELQDVNCSEMDRYIESIEFKQVFKENIPDAIKLIDIYPEHSFYFSREVDSLIITVGPKVYSFIKPYAVKDLNIPGIVNLDEFNSFLNILIRYIKEGKIKFERFEDFDLYVKYSDWLHWDVLALFSEKQVLLDYFFMHVELTVENVRKYETIFRRNWNRKLYSVTDKSEAVNFIIHSELTPKEKIKVLTCLEISRKHIKDVRDIVLEYMRDNPDHELVAYNAAYELMQRV